MFYIVYKTTNKISGKYYIGCHQTNNLNDGYLGSGKYLRSAIKKYGLENFDFEILYFCQTKYEMFEMERKLVDEKLVKDSLSYNLKIGGSGGNPGIVGAFTGKKHTIESKEKIRSYALKQKTTDQKREKISKNNWSKRNPQAFRNHMRLINLGRPKSEEQKKKISESMKGSKLINNGVVAKWAKNDELETLIEQGWIYGRIKK